MMVMIADSNEVSPPHQNRFTALFPGQPRWAGAWRELMVQGKINKGRHRNHPAGCHSIRTSQCPPPPSPHFFTGRMPFPSCCPTVSKHWRQSNALINDLWRVSVNYTVMFFLLAWKMTRAHHRHHTGSWSESLKFLAATTVMPVCTEFNQYLAAPMPSCRNRCALFVVGTSHPQLQALIGQEQMHISQVFSTLVCWFIWGLPPRTRTRSSVQICFYFFFIIFVSWLFMID